MKIITAIAAAALSFVAHAQSASPEADPAVKSAFGSYASCVMSNATLMVGNEQESAITIAEIAEVRCTDKRASVIAAVEQLLGPAPRGAAREKLTAELKASVVKRVAGEILVARQKVAQEMATSLPPAAGQQESAPFTLSCDVARGDGASVGSPHKYVVNPGLNTVNTSRATISPTVIIWIETIDGRGLIVQIDRRSGAIQGRVQGAAFSLFQGTCQREDAVTRKF